MILSIASLLLLLISLFNLKISSMLVSSIF
jgi:hypothetical protein